MFLGLFFFFQVELKNFSFERQEKTNPSPQSLVPAPTCVGGFLISSGFLSGSTLKEFEQLPGHLTEALHLFSLEDMVKVKKGLLAPLLKDILKASLNYPSFFLGSFRSSLPSFRPFQSSPFLWSPALFNQ